MCLIVDINIAERVFCKTDDPDFQPVREALLVKRRAKLHYGGKLTQEYEKSGELLRFVLALDRAGQAVQVSDKAIEQEMTQLESLDTPKQSQSNDRHILALARAGKVRLLCTLDAPLMTDFKNKTF